MADVLLRATGGTTATLLVSPVQGDATDGGQIGLTPPSFQALALGPVTFRRTRPVMAEGEAAKYELLVSASAVAEQVGLLQLGSAAALFEIVAGITIAGLELNLEGWGCTVHLGQPMFYRLMLRAGTPKAQTPQS